MGACLDSKKNLSTRILLSLIFFQLDVCITLFRTVFYSSNIVLHVKLTMFAATTSRKTVKTCFFFAKERLFLGHCMHPIIFEPPGPLSLLYDLFSLSWLELRGREREREIDAGNQWKLDAKEECDPANTNSQPTV